MPDSDTPVADADEARRFGGVARVYGEGGAARLRAAHVAVVGLGGVGSWAAEALARSAVGRLTLIDLDHIAESNTNRQLLALQSTFGRSKVDAMAERIAAINPACEVHVVDDFVTADNVAGLIDGFSVLIDCIDRVRDKAALIARCRSAGIPVFTCGAAGGRIDPTQIACADLAKAVGDPLLASVRHRLRREHGFARSDARPPDFGVMAIYSAEPVRRPPGVATTDESDRTIADAGLSCAGYGSSVVVTATMGIVAAAQAMDRLIGAATLPVAPDS
ncbi:MAG: tRNA threonylcarbamoyladenosine dehydratase [Burkholderiaceae bacterium]